MLRLLDPPFFKTLEGEEDMSNRSCFQRQFEMRKKRSVALELRVQSVSLSLAPSFATQPLPHRFSYLEEMKALKTIERGFALTQERRAMEGATCCDLGWPRMISSAACRSPSLVPLSYSEALTRARQFPLSSSCATCVCVCVCNAPPASSEED